MSSHIRATRPEHDRLARTAHEHVPEGTSHSQEPRSALQIDRELSAAFANVAQLLTREEPVAPAVIEARAVLAELTAEAGKLEDAIFQADELLKDSLREHGQTHPASERSRAAVAVVERRAGITPPPDR